MSISAAVLWDIPTPLMWDLPTPLTNPLISRCCITPQI